MFWQTTKSIYLTANCKTHKVEDTETKQAEVWLKDFMNHFSFMRVLSECHMQSSGLSYKTVSLFTGQVFSSFVTLSH